MFRFKVLFEKYTITSSRFNSYEECDKELTKAFDRPDSLGCLIEEHIENIGWVVYE